MGGDKIMSLLAILINVVILCLVFGLIYFIVGKLPLPDPFKQIALVVILVIALIVLLLMLVGQVPYVVVDGS